MTSAVESRIQSGLPLVSGNRVRLVVGDLATYREAGLLIEAARRSIDFESFTLNGPQGAGLIEALIEARRRAVSVRVVLDSKAMFFADQRRLVRRLLEGGVQVASYLERHLFNPMVAIDHAKLLLVDDRVALAGGTNYDEEINFDLNFIMEGPVVATLQAKFRQSWENSRLLGRPAVQPTLPGPLADAPPLADGDTAVAITQTAPRTSEHLQIQTFHAVVSAIAASRRSIEVLMYNMDDPQEIEALCEAHHRGVRVRVVLNPDRARGPMKWLLNHTFNLEAVRLLQRDGIPVRWYVLPPGIDQMHAKVAILDAELLLGGSTNWVHSSSHDNHELAIWLTGPVVYQTQELFEHLWQDQSTLTKKLSEWEDLRARLMGQVARVL